MEQLISVVGSLFILSAFVAVQLGKLDPTTGRYLVLNLAGSAILTVIAIVDHQWGFLLLEGVWAVVSAKSLVDLRSGRQGPGPRPATSDGEGIGGEGR